MKYVYVLLYCNELLHSAFTSKKDVLAFANDYFQPPVTIKSLKKLEDLDLKCVRLKLEKERW